MLFRSAVISGVISGLLLSGILGGFAMAAPLAVLSVGLTIGGVAGAIPSKGKEEMFVRYTTRGREVTSDRLDIPRTPHVELSASHMKSNGDKVRETQIEANRSHSIN